MGQGVPLELDNLLSARDESSRAEAWEGLMARHSALLLRVARSLGGGHDAVLDRYTFILERLRQDDFRRLRVYTPDARAQFTTWLVVVARRLCLDHHRERYGRTRPTHDTERTAARRAVRHRLADSLALAFEPEDLPDTATPAADSSVIRSDLAAALSAAQAALPARDRLLLSLRFEDDLSASKIARLLGYPTLFHVYRHLNAILGRLRRDLEARGVQSSNG